MKTKKTVGKVKQWVTFLADGLTLERFQGFQEQIVELASLKESPHWIHYCHTDMECESQRVWQSITFSSVSVKNHANNSGL